MRSVPWLSLLIAGLASACQMSPRNGQTYTDFKTPFPFFAASLSPNEALELQVQNQQSPSTWTTFATMTTGSSPDGTDVTGTKWYGATKQQQLPVSLFSAAYWRFHAGSGSTPQHRISADFRTYSPSMGLSLTSFDDTAAADECRNTQFEQNGGFAAMQNCASSRSPEAQLYVHCGRPDQACCLSYQATTVCNPGRVCNLGTSLCSLAAGGEGQPCNHNGSCNSGLACVPNGTLYGACQRPRGKVTRSWGGVDNRCVETSVPDNVIELTYSWATTKVTYASREGTRLPPDNVPFPDLSHMPDHIQGIGRIPGSDGERLMVMSISNDNVDFVTDRPGGLFFVDVGQANGHGGEAFDGGSLTDKSKNRNVAYYKMTTTHPGGLQVIGNVVATVGVDTELRRPTVYFFDVSDPINTPVSSALIQRVDLNALGPSVTDSASAVAVTRLSSGNYLMIVNGRSLDETRTVWVYLSEQTTLSSSTRWHFHNTYQYTMAFGTENIALITQCNGDVFLLHSSNPNKDLIGENGLQNYVATHKLVVKNGKFTTESLNAQAHAIQNDGHCNLRAAGGFYTTPSGKLILYCNARSIIGEDKNFKFAEWPALR